MTRPSLFCISVYTDQCCQNDEFKGKLLHLELKYILKSLGYRF